MTKHNYITFYLSYSSKVNHNEAILTASCRLRRPHIVYHDRQRGQTGPWHVVGSREKRKITKRRKWYVSRYVCECLILSSLSVHIPRHSRPTSRCPSQKALKPKPFRLRLCRGLVGRADCWKRWLGQLSPSIGCGSCK